MRNFKPKIIILLEPKISSKAGDKVCKKLGKNRRVRSEAIGLSRGIWVLWKDEGIGLKVVIASQSVVHMEVSSGGGREWQLTEVYANPTPKCQKVYLGQNGCSGGVETAGSDW